MSTSSPLILALGDSLVAGYGLSPSDTFPALLEQRLRARYSGARVVNAGVSGDTTADVLRRLPRVLSALDRRPDLAIVQAGPNDVLRQVPPATTRASLEGLLTELGRCGVPVLLTTVAPPAFLRQRAAGYLGIHAALAERHGASICDFFPDGVLGHPDMVLWDGVHPNGRAIARVVDAILPAVERVLEPAAEAAR
ncbi:GDSL-type esterase/lipase family protein [Sphingomonas jatrophae]|uniref:Acyl-CoA thioesterase-1 n=1 Tax=Sphingomonas jatrophae TaxID=1166337 RepID=A0A1I6JXJ0_9SPHN|nr:GDSL-type esterase/lipase family protein [Sphingomonas jatrophae]SFR83671.1 acyl-CoA thioesterase-1 [Sphingomonas jatrophae]